jgi:hypothetical protein
MCCVEDGLAAGVPADELEGVRVKAALVLGEAWEKMRELVPREGG